MKILLTLPLFLFFSQLCIGQSINIDSLYKTIKTTHRYEKFPHDWNDHLLKFYNQENLVVYILRFDENNKIDESIGGIALSMFLYDSLGRSIEDRYYNKQGKLQKSDWPPILKTTYNEQGQIFSKTYYGEDNKPMSVLAKIEFYYDSTGKVIEERSFDENFKLTGPVCITKFEYNEKNNIVYISEYDNAYKIHLRRGYAYEVEVYESSKRKNLLERFYLDINKEKIK